MALPIPFLLALLVVVAHREFGFVLPGAGTVPVLLATLPVLLVPPLLALLAHRSFVRLLVRGAIPTIPPGALLRLSALATPLAVHTLFSVGCYDDWLDRWSPDSNVGRIALALLPVYATELARMLFATRFEVLMQTDLDAPIALPVRPSSLPLWSEVRPIFRLRLGWPLLALLPALLLGVGLDVLQLHRWSYVFVFVSSVGISVAMVAFLVLTSMLLPSWFRIAFGARVELPSSVASAVRATAEVLGFSPRRVLMLPTGLRTMNAMLVGPLPVGRVQCLTDGLMAGLDTRSLSGVVAHEIGHARMGHPGLLMMLAVVVPVMVLSPAKLLDLDAVDVVVQAAVLTAVMLLLWFGLRSLARRFEHEADIASVRALGAGPCSRALLTVGRMSVPAMHGWRGRLLSMHPEERHRIAVMQRYETEPTFRSRFDRRSRAIRRAIAGLLAVSLAVGAWSWSVEWPYERPFVRFYSGDFVGAREALQALPDRPERWRQAFGRLEQDLAAAIAMAADARDWQTARAALQEQAWRRGEQVLLQMGPAAARPWLALAVDAMEAPDPTELAIYAFCRAAADNDPETMAELAEIIRRRGPPRSLVPVFELPR